MNAALNSASVDSAQPAIPERCRRILPRLPSLARLLSLALLLTGLTSPASAQEMRCGESLIQRGFTPLEVLERCGAPEFQMRWTDYRYPGVWLRIDEWTYDLGSNKFRRLLTFENGRLVRIELRDKPKTPAE